MAEVKMSFSMSGSVTLNRDIGIVWDALNDKNVLKASIPGCQELVHAKGTSYTAKVRVKIGPIAANFNGSIELQDITPPTSYRIVGSGSAGIAGAASGGARVTLVPTAVGTLLEYTVDASISGKIAQLGNRLIDSVAKRQADLFFDNFANLLLSR
jgi:uncharacterized protein